VIAKMWFMIKGRRNPSEGLLPPNSCPPPAPKAFRASVRYLVHSPGNADIAALSDVASGVSDDEAKSEIAENAKRFSVSTDQPRTLSEPAGMILMYFSPITF
jgi:hypothetical protein